jgi:hypothetical protein
LSALFGNNAVPPRKRCCRRNLCRAPQS